MNTTKTLLIGILAFGCNNVQAGLINPGFETNMSSWSTQAPTPSGFGSTPPSLTPVTSFGAMTPAEGSKFLKLTTNGAPALTVTNTSASNYLTQSNWVLANQTANFSAGDIFKFNFAFNPNPPFADVARASIFQVLNGVTTNVFSIILQTGTATKYQLDQYGTASTTNIAYSPFTSAWQLITVPIYTTGTYKIEFAVANIGSALFASNAFFDSYQQVPEASTLSLFALGLLGLAQLKTRKTA